MQSDPLGLEGGENSFVYVGDNPLVRVDERGLFFDRVLAGAGAAIGSIIEPGGGTAIGAAIGAAAGKWLDRWIVKTIGSVIVDIAKKNENTSSNTKQGRCKDLNNKVKNAKGKVSGLGKCKEGMSRYELLVRK